MCLCVRVVLQYATDYKTVAVGNDTNGTILYQKVGRTGTSLLLCLLLFSLLFNLTRTRAHTRTLMHEPVADDQQPPAGNKALTSVFAPTVVSA